MEIQKENKTEAPVSRGRRWLGLIGLEHLADQPTTERRGDGSVILFGEFDEICGDHPQVQGGFNALERGLGTPEARARFTQLLQTRAVYYLRQVEVNEVHREG